MPSSSGSLLARAEECSSRPTKSIVTRIEIDAALRAHSCQANRRHRLERGDPRLKVRSGRSWDHYCAACAACAAKILEQDIAKLRLLLERLRSGLNEADARVLRLE